MFVEIALIACLDLDNRATCISRHVTASPMSFTECQGPTGQNVIVQHLTIEPLHDPWRFGGWSCKWGNKPAPKQHEA
jgi:hypothetical protein